MSETNETRNNACTTTVQSLGLAAESSLSNKEINLKGKNTDMHSSSPRDSLHTNVSYRDSMSLSRSLRDPIFPHTFALQQLPLAMDSSPSSYRSAPERRPIVQAMMQSSNDGCHPPMNNIYMEASPSSFLVQPESQPESASNDGLHPPMNNTYMDESFFLSPMYAGFDYITSNTPYGLGSNDYTTMIHE